MTCSRNIPSMFMTLPAGTLAAALALPVAAQQDPATAPDRATQLDAVQVLGSGAGARTAHAADARNDIVVQNRRAEHLLVSRESDSEGRRRAVEINNLLFTSFLANSMNRSEQS